MASTQRIRDSIDRVLTRQDSNGAFGLWSANDAGDDLWLDAFTTDFLTRAREAGFAVPQRSFDLALDRLRNQVANSGDVKKEQAPSIAYAIYVLARNGRPVMGDLRYLVDTKISEFDTGARARATRRGARAARRQGARADRVRRSGRAIARRAGQSLLAADYGSRLRDGAGLLALAAEAGADQALIQLAGGIVQSERNATTFLSTQEMNWMVLAAAALSRDGQNMALTVDGQAHTGPLYRTWKASELDAGATTIVNTSSAPASVVLTTAGHPAQIEPALAQGYEVERSYFSLDGKPKDLASVRQNDRFVVVLKVTEAEAAFARLLLVDRLPAGLEIDNPRLFDGGKVEALSFAKATVEPTHTEYRDDSFVAAFERNGRERATFNVAYVVRAVTPGRYVQPAATIEDMYRPAAVRPHGFGRDRGRRAALMESNARANDLKRARSRRGFACAFALVATTSLAVPFAWHSVKRSLGPLDLSQLDDGSTIAVDRDGKLLRAFTTDDGRWRLPVTHADVDPRFLAMLQAYEDRRFTSHSGVDARALGRAVVQLARNGRVISGRLHADHAGRAPAGAARGAHARRQTAADGARHRTRAAFQQERNPRHLSRPGALRRQSRRIARGERRLFRQGAAAADHGRTGPARGAAAIAGSAQAGSQSESRARGARPCARSCGAPWRHHGGGGDCG